ncbi:YlaI family protein [Bacillus gobiensis]|uniref:YlaI family protein n=1 Tax=Bacillus gobiensis TaxID=1441095 RepID=UPI003D1DBFBD
MRVKCSLCDINELINDESPVAKRLRNRPIHTYLCQDCHDRITNKTKERLSTGRFSLYKDREEKGQL